MIDDRLGNPLYAVFAASTRIAAVANCRNTNTNPLPNTCSPSCAITVRSWLGYGCRRWASTEMPKNSVPSSTPIHTSVVAAFFAAGRRNAGTPFEIASTPVSATAPDEKPFSSRNSVERAAELVRRLGEVRVVGDRADVAEERTVRGRRRSGAPKTNM